jgi:hypothetical protein
MREMEIAHEFSVGKTKENTPLRRPRHIKIIIKYMSKWIINKYGVML